jgi:Resolvase, N terminal domain
LRAVPQGHSVGVLPGAERLADRCAKQNHPLLVYRVDQLSRKVRQLAQLTEELDGLGVVLKSATEPFDTGATAGPINAAVLAVRRVRASGWPGFRHASTTSALEESRTLTHSAR